MDTRLQTLCCKVFLGCTQYLVKCFWAADDNASRPPWPVPYVVPVAELYDGDAARQPLGSAWLESSANIWAASGKNTGC